MESHQRISRQRMTRSSPRILGREPNSRKRMGIGVGRNGDASQVDIIISAGGNKSNSLEKKAFVLRYEFLARSSIKEEI